jgi:TatD DNase family protein
VELIDIGVNLAHESFAADLDAVLDRATQSGVGRMVVTGTSVESTRAALALHRRFPRRLTATAGVHPHQASDLDSVALAALGELAREPGIVAVGECGLDFFRNFSPREAQLAAFSRQLELAATTRKPVFLHQRDAHRDFIAVLREHRAGLVGGVAHCFTGDAGELDDYLALDLYIGITGWICDERRGEHLKPLVARIPAERLLVETDAPYLLPRTLRPRPPGRRNEPAFLPEVARVIAAARGEDVEQLASTSTAAAVRLFGLPRPHAVGDAG